MFYFIILCSWEVFIHPRVYEIFRVHVLFNFLGLKSGFIDIIVQILYLYLYDDAILFQRKNYVAKPMYS